jgi:glutamyl-tRNA synthetase
MSKGADRLAAVAPVLAQLDKWDAATVEKAIRAFVASEPAEGLTLRDIAQPLRAALTGSTVSPPLFDVMEVLGQRETRDRLDDALGRSAAE